MTTQSTLRRSLQAITAAGSGCAAALDAERYLAALDHQAATSAAALVQ